MNILIGDIGNTNTKICLVEYKTFKIIEKRALYFAKMYGRMPHFLKTYNKKIYIHENRAKDDGTWWAQVDKREFHINESICETGGPEWCLETMIHELAHVIQDITGAISPSKWLKARKLDNKKYC